MTEGQAQLASLLRQIRNLESYLSGRVGAHGYVNHPEGTPDADSDPNTPGARGEIIAREFLLARTGHLYSLHTPIPGNWKDNSVDLSLRNDDEQPVQLTRPDGFIYRSDYAVQTVAPDHCFLVRDDVPNNTWCLLVWDRFPIFEFPGFILAKDARTLSHLRRAPNDRPPAYFIGDFHLTHWPQP